MKIFVSKEKFDYADTRFSNFAIKYLLENEKARETVYACLYLARSNLLSKKNGQKSRDTVLDVSLYFPSASPCLHSVLCFPVLANSLTWSFICPLAFLVYYSFLLIPCHNPFPVNFFSQTLSLLSPRHFPGQWCPTKS